MSATNSQAPTPAPLAGRHGSAVLWFTVQRRNFGHWDVCGDAGRMFAIRGEPGDVVIRDERKGALGIRPGFPTVEAAMAWVVGKLMTESPNASGSATAGADGAENTNKG